jgi:hypothetical protein
MTDYSGRVQGGSRRLIRCNYSICHYSNTCANKLLSFDYQLKFSPWEVFQFQSKVLGMTQNPITQRPFLSCDDWSESAMSNQLSTTLSSTPRSLKLCSGMWFLKVNNQVNHLEVELLLGASHYSYYFPMKIITNRFVKLS